MGLLDMADWELEVEQWEWLKLKLEYQAADTRDLPPMQALTE